jgi:hypothetical protein
VSKEIPSNRFRFEMVNPDMFRTTYSDSDPFAPDLYEMDYLFAAVMCFSKSNDAFLQRIF